MIQNDLHAEPWSAMNWLQDRLLSIIASLVEWRYTSYYSGRDNLWYVPMLPTACHGNVSKVCSIHSFRSDIESRRRLHLRRGELWNLCGQQAYSLEGWWLLRLLEQTYCTGTDRNFFLAEYCALIKSLSRQPSWIPTSSPGEWECSDTTVIPGFPALLTHHRLTETSRHEHYLR
jgi:hypothetical protein